MCIDRFFFTYFCKQETNAMMETMTLENEYFYITFTYHMAWLTLVSKHFGNDSLF